MAVRDAQFSDIPAMVGLLKRAYQASHYAKSGTVQVDEGVAKRILIQAIQRHGGKSGGACFIQVSETDGFVRGLIVATLARVYAIGDKLMASDLFWVADDAVEIADPKQLMKNMIAWAEGNRHVAEIKCGTTAVISDDPKRAGRILEHLGLAHYGELYRKEL